MALESLGGTFSGISISKKKNNTTSFFITYKDENGVPRRLKVGDSPEMTKTKARELLINKKREIQGTKDLLRGNPINSLIPPIVAKKRSKEPMKTAYTLNELADYYFDQHDARTLKALKFTYDAHLRKELFADKLIQLITKDEIVEWIEKKKVQRSDKRRNIKDTSKTLELRELEELTKNQRAIELLSVKDDWISKNKIKFLQEWNKVLEMRTNPEKRDKLWADKYISEDEKRAILGILAIKTIRELIGTAQTIINYAIDEKNLVIANPFKFSRRDFKKYRLEIDNVRDRYMTKEELRTFLKECKEVSKKPKHKNIYLMALLGLSIAARQQTIMTIRISDINFETGLIELRNHKTQKTYNGFIGGDEIKAELLKIIGKRDKKEYLFVNYTGNRPYRFPRVLGEILDYTVNYNRRFFEWLSMRDMRNTAASHLTMQGVPLKFVSQVLNHAQIAMTERYAHLAPDTSKEGVANLVSSYSLHELDDA